MSTLTPGTSLPFVPGMTFSDPTKQNYHLSQTLGYKNGYAMKNQPMYPIGGGKIELSKIDAADVLALDKEHLELIYSDRERCEIGPFVPAHVALDKKVLHFKGYYTEEIVESPIETERTRFLDVYYYLVDDSVAITEPMVENSGIPQGKFLTRQRLPTGEGAAVLHWTNLNVAQDLIVYGKRVRLYECDAFTREYLTSEGIEVNSNETGPPNVFAQSRVKKQQTYTTPSSIDKYGQFLTLDRKVLRFYAIWDDRKQLFGEARKFVIHFYLSDDTMEIKEVHEANNGRDPFPTLVTRQRIPKMHVAKTFPSMEHAIVKESQHGYYKASDFLVGDTVDITNRKMFIYDADGATRTFVSDHFGVQLQPAVNLSNYLPTAVSIQHKLPEYNGFGSLEDSEQNCKKISPDRPKKNYIKMLRNGNETLRFKAKMMTNKELDQSRTFIIQLRLSDDYIAIQEIQQRNSGLPAGRFLEYSRIPKPGSSASAPEWYEINDLKIGNIIIAFSHRFEIIGCDLHVLNWIEKQNEKSLAVDFVESVRTHLNN